MKTKTFFLMLIITVGLFIPYFAGADVKPYTEAKLTVQTLDYSKGQASSRNSLIFQPAIKVGYGEFSFEMGAKLDSSPYIATSNTTGASKVKETALSLAYAKQLDIFKMGITATHYGKDGAKDEREVSLSLGLDVLLAPTFAIYQTVGIKPATYLTLGVAHCIPITKSTVLNLSATAGYLTSQTKKEEGHSATYYTTRDNGSLSDDKYSGFLDGVVSVGVCYDLGHGIFVEPFISYALPLSNDAKNYFKANSPQGFANGSTSHLFGGVRMSANF